MEEVSEIQRLMDEGHAILLMMDAVDAREEKQRTMGSMALSSYRSDMYHRALGKFNQALELHKAGEEGKLEP